MQFPGISSKLSKVGKHGTYLLPLLQTPSLLLKMSISCVAYTKGSFIQIQLILIFYVYLTDFIITFYQNNLTGLKGLFRIPSLTLNNYLHFSLLQCVYMCVYIYIHTHIHTNLYSYIHTYVLLSIIGIEGRNYDDWPKLYTQITQMLKMNQNVCCKL